MAYYCHGLVNVIYLFIDKWNIKLKLRDLFVDNVLRIDAVNAKRESESMLTFAICKDIACLICAGEIPRALFISPPYLFICLTYFCGIVDAPCKTSGVFGISLAICSKISKRNDSFALFRLYAPCDVPIATANESVFVCLTKSLTTEGSVYEQDDDFVFSSSIPDNTPSSVSSDTLNLWT